MTSEGCRNLANSNTQNERLWLCTTHDAHRNQEMLEQDKADKIATKEQLEVHSKAWMVSQHSHQVRVWSMPLSKMKGEDKCQSDGS